MTSPPTLCPLLAPALACCVCPAPMFCPSELHSALICRSCVPLLTRSRQRPWIQGRRREGGGQEGKGTRPKTRGGCYEQLLVWEGMGAATHGGWAGQLPRPRSPQLHLELVRNRAAVGAVGPAVTTGRYCHRLLKRCLHACCGLCQLQTVVSWYTSLLGPHPRPNGAWPCAHLRTSSCSALISSSVSERSMLRYAMR